MEYLIDPDGSWWRWPSPVLSARLGYEEPDFDLAAYAARNLGYVWIVLESDLTPVAIPGRRAEEEDYRGGRRFHWPLVRHADSPGLLCFRLD